MALDHALVRRAAQRGDAVLRVYTWCRATVSFGRHQPARLRYDRAALSGAALDVVRRPTGGRAVLHDREITYSVTAPLGGADEVGGGRRAPSRGFYAAVNELLVAALVRIGVSARTATGGGSGATPSLGAPGPCFNEAAEGEVVVNNRKLVGSAQWREGEAVLQHGSILVADDQSRLAAFSRVPVAATPTATLGSLLGRQPRVAEVAAAIRGALDDTLRNSGAPPTDVLQIDDDLAAAARALEHQYASDEWTWRR